MKILGVTTIDLMFISFAIYGIVSIIKTIVTFKRQLKQTKEEDVLKLERMRANIKFIVAKIKVEEAKVFNLDK